MAVAGGLLIGAVNGFLGGGGGLLCVPLLQRVNKLPAKKAHATAILVMLPISAVSLIVYLAGGRLPLVDGTVIAGGVIAGGLAGALLLSKLPAKAVGVVFAGLMIAAGVKLLFF